MSICSSEKIAESDPFNALRETRTSSKLFGDICVVLQPHVNSRTTEKGLFTPPSFSIFSSIINIMYELIRKTWSLALWGFRYPSKIEWLWASSPSSLMWELLSFRALFPLCFTLAMKKKKLKKIGKSPVKPNLPISCCFTVKASKLYQNSLHCFYGNAVFDGAGFWKSFFTCDGSVKYIPLV